MFQEWTCHYNYIAVIRVSLVILPRLVNFSADALAFTCMFMLSLDDDSEEEEVEGTKSTSPPPNNSSSDSKPTRSSSRTKANSTAGSQAKPEDDLHSRTQAEDNESEESMVS